MIRSVFVIAVVFFFTFLVGFSLHQFFIENQQITLPFSLKKIYLFHLVFSLLVCTNFQLLSSVNNLFDQLGFIYLVTIVLKIVLFCITFYKSIFITEKLSLASRVSLFVPMIIFLSTEVVFIAKILNKKQ